MKKVPDPYRELGIPRGATAAQIKAAHRRLAKRVHPDAPDGDTERFLAVQEAYSLLSDPLRRREWDARHAPGPVRAGEPGVRSRPRTRGSDGRWTRSDGQEAPGAGRGRGRSSREGAAEGTGWRPCRRPAPGWWSWAAAASEPDRRKAVTTGPRAPRLPGAPRSGIRPRARIPGRPRVSHGGRTSRHVTGAPESEAAEASPEPRGGEARAGERPPRVTPAAGTGTRAGRSATGRARDTRRSPAGPAEPVPGTRPRPCQRDGRLQPLQRRRLVDGRAALLPPRRRRAAQRRCLPLPRHAGRHRRGGSSRRRRGGPPRLGQPAPRDQPRCSAAAPGAAATSGTPAATESGSPERPVRGTATVQSHRRRRMPTPDLEARRETGSAADSVLGRVGRLFRGR